jgi:hypothetical protein
MTYRAPESIRLGVTQASEGVGDLEDLLLEEQDAFAISQDRREDRMRRPEVVSWRPFPGRLHRIALAILLVFGLLGFAPFDVGVHEAALNRPGTKQRGLYNQVIEGLWCPMTIRLDTLARGECA